MNAPFKTSCYSFRGVTQDAHSEGAEALTRKGVEVVEGFGTAGKEAWAKKNARIVTMQDLGSEVGDTRGNLLNTYCT